MDRDGYISNGELFIVLKMMVGQNLRDEQLQQIVDKVCRHGISFGRQLWKRTRIRMAK